MITHCNILTVYLEKLKLSTFLDFQNYKLLWNRITELEGGLGDLLVQTSIQADVFMTLNISQRGDIIMEGSKYKK